MKKLFALAVLAVSMFLAGCGDKKPAQTFNSVDITGAAFAKDFTLTDHLGQQRSLADFRGKVVFMFFGFTQCPDVCPTTMAKLAGVMKELGPKAEQVQVLFVTVDPERDTRELLAQYAPTFDARFIGLSGTPEQTAAVAKEFKIFYSKVEGTTPGNYSIDHTAASYIFDKAGKVRLMVPHAKTQAEIAHDIAMLL
ncbi:MAG: SCO family protein [Duganella sp.]